MIRAIIIDDEKDARDTLEIRLLEGAKDVEIVAIENSAKTGIEAIKLYKPQLVFLDIQMPRGDGFSVINYFEADEIDFDVVFTTAHDEYTLEAIKVSVFDYLLKPISEEELGRVIKKYRKKMKSLNDTNQIKMLTGLSKHDEKLMIPTSGGFEMVAISEIIYCEADRNYTKVILQDKQKLVSKTLKEFDAMLSEFNFFRIHQSYLINLKHVESYKKSDGGQVIMTNNDVKSISNKKKEQFLSLFSKL